MFIDQQYVTDKVKKLVDNPIFAAIAGSRLAGVYHQHSPYLIRGCCVNFLPVLDEKNDGAVLRSSFHTSPRSEIKINFEVQAFDYFIQRLKNREISAIEEVFSPFVFMESKYYQGLKSITKMLFAKDLYPKFKELFFEIRTNLDLQNPPETSTVLELFRLHMLGIYLFRLGKFNPNLIRLNEYFNNNLVKEILEKLQHRGETIYFGNMEDVKESINTLSKDLDTAYKYTRLPRKLNKTDFIFDDYLEKVTKLIKEQDQTSPKHK